VRTTIVDGVVVVDEFRLLTADAGAIVAEASVELRAPLAHSEALQYTPADDDEGS
jgi:hypothetical protein